MPKRPSFQFYPADWLSNGKLRGATPTDRGLWMDVMCLLHDSDEYGILRVNLEEIARRIPCHVNQLRSLAHKDILKGAPKGGKTQELTYCDAEGVSHLLLPPQDGPCWFSSRMVIDEFKRERAKANGKLGGNPVLKNQSDSPPREGVNPRVNPPLKRKREMKSSSGNGEGAGEERAAPTADFVARMLARKASNGRNGRS